MVFDDRVRCSLPPSNRWEQFLTFVQELDRLEPGSASDFRTALTETAERMQRREVVVIVSDFLGDLLELERALQRFRYQGHDVLLLQLLHPQELDLDLTGSVRFQDLETGAYLTCRPEDLRAAYQEELQLLLHQCHDQALRNDCEHLLFNTGQDLREAIADVLTQRP